MGEFINWFTIGEVKLIPSIPRGYIQPEVLVDD